MEQHTCSMTARRLAASHHHGSHKCWTSRSERSAKNLGSPQAATSTSEFADVSLGVHERIVESDACGLADPRPLLAGIVQRARKSPERPCYCTSCAPPLALRLTHDGGSAQSEDEDVKARDATIQCDPRTDLVTTRGEIET